MSRKVIILIKDGNVKGIYSSDETIDFEVVDIDKDLRKDEGETVESLVDGLAQMPA